MRSRLRQDRSRCARRALAMTIGATLQPAPAFAQANPYGLSREQIERECRQILYYDECVAAGGYRAWSEGQSNQRSGSSGWTAERQLYTNQPGTAVNPGSSGWSADRQLYRNQPGTAPNNGSPGWAADRQTYKNQPGTSDNPGSPGWDADRQVYRNQPGTAENKGSPGWSADRQTYANQPGTAENKGSPGWSADRQVYSNQPGTSKNRGSSGWSADRQTYANQPGTSSNPGSSGWSADRQQYHQPSANGTRTTVAATGPNPAICPGLKGEARTSCLRNEANRTSVDAAYWSAYTQSLDRSWKEACRLAQAGDMAAEALNEGEAPQVQWAGRTWLIARALADAVMRQHSECGELAEIREMIQRRGRKDQ